jgi:hypothetical protein
MLASEEISGRVARVLVESLNADEDDLKPTATLQGDLGAESIDFTGHRVSSGARVRHPDPARRVVP